jgi:hypothetical protein
MNEVGAYWNSITSMFGTEKMMVTLSILEKAKASDTDYYSIETTTL